MRNGPKGTALLSFFFFRTIKVRPTIAPTRNEKNIDTRTLGKPIKSPIKRPSLTSPKPIHFPLEIRNIAKKKAETPKPEKT